jgi:hypothetical protein
LNKELLQKLIYMESLYFHPEEGVAVPASPSVSPFDPLLSKETALMTPPPVATEVVLQKRKDRESQDNEVDKSSPSAEQHIKRIKGE